MTDYPHPYPAPRSGPEERNYLLRRAKDHSRLAEITDEPGSRMIHLRLQKLYNERAALAAIVVSD